MPFGHSIFLGFLQSPSSFHWIFVPVLCGWQQGALSLSERASETPLLMSPES